MAAVSLRARPNMRCSCAVLSSPTPHSLAQLWSGEDSKHIGWLLTEPPHTGSLHSKCYQPASEQSRCVLTICSICWTSPLACTKERGSRVPVEQCLAEPWPCTETQQLETTCLKGQQFSQHF